MMAVLNVLGALWALICAGLAGSLVFTLCRRWKDRR